MTDLPCSAGGFQAQICGAGLGTHQTILHNEWPYCEPWHSNVFKMWINIQSVKQLHSSLVHPSPGISLVEYNLLQLSWMSYDKDGVRKRSWDIEVWWSTILFISTSANDLPSHSMLHIILSQAQEICIAADGLLFCSFTINCCCAACCNATLSADWAAILALDCKFKLQLSCLHQIADYNSNIIVPILDMCSNCLDWDMVSQIGRENILQQVKSWVWRCVHQGGSSTRDHPQTPSCTAGTWISFMFSSKGEWWNVLRSWIRRWHSP